MGRNSSRNNKKNKLYNDNFELKKILPKTENQEKAFYSFFSGQHLFLHGIAGTGKTFIALYLSLKELFEGITHKIIIVRSAVASRDLGFLPGTLAEKLEPYEMPYRAMLSELMGRGDAYEILKKKGNIEFVSTSHLRGITLNNCIIIVEECQNMGFGELDTVITRLGNNCRIIFSGDYRQTDLIKTADKAGLIDFMRIIQRLKEFDFIEFQISDIVRNPLIKNYIIQKTSMNL